MFRLCTATNLPEAHLLLHRLEQAGIEARVLNEHAQGGLGEIPFTHAYPEIWVMEEADEARARAILAEFERPPASREPVRCRDCGEMNPPAFEICWQCGKALR
jgi:Putative prokaryotic signal transducing protein